VIDAQRKKPKLPVHALVTAQNPLIRFIGSDDMEQNRQLFSVWLEKLPQWEQQSTPYLFLHTPITVSRRNSWTYCGKIFSRRCRHWALLRPFRSNLLFSEWITYHCKAIRV
jgi:hypothetical protein